MTMTLRVDEPSSAVHRLPAQLNGSAPARPHVVVLHRWRDRYALYADYIDHATHAVSYVTTALGRDSIPATAAAVVEIGATDDLGQVLAAVDALTRRFGRPQRLVALNEGDLDVAASAREAIGCAGQRPPALSRFRDKLPMVAAVAAAGIDVPAYADAPTAAAVLAFATTQGWPVVVKPRRGTASRGVATLTGPRDVAAYDFTTEPHLVETFVDDPILHIDGLWTGSALGPWRASRYLNTCVDFAAGDFLGSVEMDDEPLLHVLEVFTAAVANALSDEPWVFHIEAFLGVADGRPRLTFLEAGARVGGAEIPFVWRDVHGVDLMSAAIDLQLGRTPQLRATGSGEVAGWLLLPVPGRRPCVVVEAALDLPAGQGPYAARVPSPGDVIPDLGGYEHVGARFRFRGRTSDDVAQAIRRTAAATRVRCEPLPATRADRAEVMAR